jgi:hypothetical protein
MFVALADSNTSEKSTSMFVASMLKARNATGGLVSRFPVGSVGKA